jgi:cell division septum initiation protein DivIVA
MTNPVFENAITSLHSLSESVEAEIVRLAGVHQQVEAQKTQKAELQRENATAAEKLAAARREVADATTTAKDILDAACRERDKIIADARIAAARMHDDAAGARAVKAELDAVIARLASVKA